MNELLRIEAEVTFLPASEGGREPPPELSGGGYRPHVVVGEPARRRAAVIGNAVQETYLGVAFETGPERVEAGKPFLTELTLLYYPQVAYDPLVNGATFTIREGPVVVGFGKVTRGLAGHEN